jgi:hypothetical protein
LCGWKFRIDENEIDTTPDQSAQKASASGLCKPWKQGWDDKKSVRDIRHAQRAEQLLHEAGF